MVKLLGKVAPDPISEASRDHRLALGLAYEPGNTQMGNNKMEAMAETKLLDFNMDKSCLMVIGKKKKVREDMENKLAENPPLLYGKKMKQVKVDKYLGEKISSGGLAESVAATANKRTVNFRNQDNDWIVL